MRDVLPELMRWWEAGETIGVGTVVATFRSAPRPAGASMLVGPDDSAVGSVSGGCVEGAVYDLAQTVVASGEPVLERYGVSDDDAFAVGLTCGGILDVFVERVSRETFPQLGEVAADIEAGRPVALATVIEHPDPAWVGRRLVVRPHLAAEGSLGSPRADAAVHDDALGVLAAGTNATLTYGPDGERRGEGMRVFVWGFAPKPRMLVFGAIDFAAAVAKVGSFLGYHVTVCDARPVFATTSRFPGADEVVVDWPHRYLQAELDAGRIDRRTVLAVLTHDPKFDVPCSRSRCASTTTYAPATSAPWARAARTTSGWPGSSRQGWTRPSWPCCPHRSGSTSARAPRGDRRVDRGGDRGPPVGRLGGAAGRDAGPHPPRRLTRWAAVTTTTNWPVAWGSLMVSGMFLLPALPRVLVRPTAALVACGPAAHRPGGRRLAGTGAPAGAEPRGASPPVRSSPWRPSTCGRGCASPACATTSHRCWTATPRSSASRSGSSAGRRCARPCRSRGPC